MIERSESARGPVGEEAAGRHIVMGNSWSVCGVNRSHTFMSSSDCACVKILSWCFIPRVSAWFFSAGGLSLSLATALSLAS